MESISNSQINSTSIGGIRTSSTGCARNNKKGGILSDITLICSERETGIEPATPSLARRCSTAEPLAHTCYRFYDLYVEGMKLIVTMFSCAISQESSAVSHSKIYNTWFAGKSQVYFLNYLFFLCNFYNMMVRVIQTNDPETPSIL